MSIADKITQLTTIRASMREKLVAKGVDASTHNFADFPNDVESIPSGGGGIDYSTTEQDTGLKWIDGKPVYQTTFTKRITSTDSWNIVPHSIPFQSIISINASYNYVQDSQARVVPMPYCESSNGRTQVLVWQTGIYFQIGQSFPINGTAVLTIRYTKTTD